MDQLTVRGFDEQLSASVRRLSKREGISLDQASLKLLRKGAGLSDDRGGADTIGPALDHMIGAPGLRRSGRTGLRLAGVRDRWRRAEMSPRGRGIAT